MLKLINKGIDVYKDQGAKFFIIKTAGFFNKKITTYTYRFLPQKLKTRIDIKGEEFNFLSNKIFQIDSSDIKKSIELTEVNKPNEIQTANWFVPYFDHLAFGGIYTIFRFINYFGQQGVKNRVIIYDKPDIDLDKIQSDISNSFPDMKNFEVIVFSQDKMNVNDLPESDIAICTFWVSAYFLLKFNKTKRKYYFIQDYEPLFYPGGAIFALAESTYRFGFKGIVNTPGLLAAVNQRHGLEGISFVPAVDRSVYYPAKDKKIDKDKVKIFFYARPNNPRNAFILGVQIIKQLIEKYGERVEIITAGAEWKERQYGLHNLINNKGLLKSIPEVADLYRECDIGFVYMLSKHPSYQPFEFMASGMATVTNNNEDNLWLLRHEENCLLAEPSPKAMVEQISRLIEDEKLRKKIVKNSLKTVENEWQWQTELIWNDLKNSKN